MALFNTINLIPEVFRSTTNERFLGATMDQLAVDAVNVPVHGYIGRTFAPTYKSGDNYVPEATKFRSNYQLEPSVVIKDTNDNVELNSNYLDLLQSIANNGGYVNNQQRLFTGQYYNYDGKFNYDKFVNHNNYYWIPGGPDAVNITSSTVPLLETFTVIRNTAVNGYSISNTGGHANPIITLARGGTYQFNVNQPGNQFWIQSEPGVSGTDSNIPTVNTRQVFGVQNNGTDNGTVTFNVPLATAQDFYSTMPIAATVNAAVTFAYTDIQNTLLSTFLSNFPEGLDSITNLLLGKTFVFIGGQVDDSYWTTPSLPGAFMGTGSGNIVAGSVIANPNRTSVWQINLVPSGTDYLIQISPVTTVQPLQKVFVSSGKTYASLQFWLNKNYIYTAVPQITAPSDYLYYQDSNNPDYYGIIKLVDTVSTPINVTTDIIGQTNYTSPNRVIFTNGLKVTFDTLVVPSSYAGNEYYVEGVGTGITLVPVDQMAVPESFGADIGTTADYITINRASQDQNAWSRSNCWFHKDVLAATANYNSTSINYGPNIPARRAIIEFEPNLQLFNFGKQAKLNVDFFVNTSTDAFVDIEGQISYTLQGVALEPGMRIVFAQDYDSTVKNQIWQVDIEIIANTNYIRLIKTNDDPVVAGQNLVATNGTNAGVTFWFDGTTWYTAQQKTSVNQSPLFDLFDSNGYSFGDTTVYPGTTFAGSALFGYPVVSGTADSVLGFPLQYQNFNNIGDIVFQNYYDTGTFTYTESGTTTTVNCNSGYIAINSGLDSVTTYNNWVAGVENTNQSQVITKFHDGYTVELDGVNYAFIQIDALPTASTTVPHLKVFLNNVLLTPTVDYRPVAYGVYTLLILTNMPSIGDKIDVEVLSNTQSTLGYYEIPENLDFNPLNENFDTITLGQMRTHYNKLIENTSVSSDVAIPLRDQYLKAQGGTLLQHSSPLPYAMTFLTDPTVNFINGIELARKEYTRFKNKFLSLCTNLSGIDYTNPVTGVDAILKSINAVKNSSFPWYYSDMVPQGANYTTTTYTVLNARQTAYNISSIFDIAVPSNRAVLIYLNGAQLVYNQDYTFSTINPSVIFNVSLTVGDTITIRDYSSTDGNYIPETPTKLGLYPGFVPQIYVDNTFLTPTTVIQGHDGSITPAFGDFRDDFLLELEKRIYNNLKVDYYSNSTITVESVIPGRFRSTDYSLTEWNQLLSQHFLQWVGTNSIDYTTNSWFDPNNSWTWNYSQTQDLLDGSFLQGSWRAIYNYWFDTTTPHTTPWEMLGFGEEPDWWQKRYGPAPYTSGNGTLWEDLEAGYIWNNNNPYTNTFYARPGLSNFIPVDNGGNLLTPMQAGIVAVPNTSTLNGPFTPGQVGPVEAAWQRSSDYAYAIQTAFALARPAQYFAIQLDTSRFNTNKITGQVSNSSNQRISPSLIAVNGDTVTNPGTTLRTAGYINWIGDYIKNLGIDPVTKINQYLSKFNVQLSYRVAGFTDQNLITVRAEQTTPGSTNASVIIPDENYKVYVGKPVPLASISYSAVIVTKTNTGYSVSGYDTARPYFTIYPSVVNNNTTSIVVNNLSVKVYGTGSTTPTVIPYGTSFNNIQQVADFLVSYQRYLEAVGFVFDNFNTDLQALQDWKLSINEYLFWVQQNWAEGTIIVLNPINNTLKVGSIGAVIDQVTNLPNGSKLLDTNFNPIKNNSFDIIRSDSPISNINNTTVIQTIDNKSIAFARLNLVQYETTLIFDNVDDFGDIVYIPEQGTRQYRLRLDGTKTGGWTGALSAPGYIYSDPQIKNWQPGVDYKQGDIVTYNNSYYTAPTNIVANQNFALSNWTRINLSDIQTGLLPSFGHNAQVFQNIYDVDIPPQDENFQVFSSGLIGFRERPFLSNLGISVSTQTKFYQGYVKQKGTANAIDALTKATFDTVNSSISTYEEWAFRVGTYGALDTTRFVETVLDQSVFLTNPVALTLTANTYSTANTIIDLSLSSNVYNSSNVLNTTSNIYSNRSQAVYSTDLPSTGYVNVADVDYQIFDIATAGNIGPVTTGSKIWTAKDNNGSWNVFRATETNYIATTLKYTLDSYAQLTFNNPHNLNVGDYFILQGFNSKFDGIYGVISTTPFAVVIELANASTLIKTNSVATGTGIVLKLVSVVLPTVTSIATSAPPLGWKDNEHVWVNNAVDGWGVYTYNHAWLTNTSVRLTANTITSNAQFGSAVTFNSNEQFIYAGSPNTATVQVFANVGYTFTSNATVSSNAGSAFGASIVTEGNLVAIGAPLAGNVMIYRQNDYNTPNEPAITWANVTPWFPSLILDVGSTISYEGNIFVTTGNVFGTFFGAIQEYAQPALGYANIANIGPGQLITYDGLSYITNTGNVVARNISTLVSQGNVRQIDRATGNIAIAQTITANAGAGSSVALSTDQHWLYVGNPTENVVFAYYAQYPQFANVNYSLVNSISIGSATDQFGMQVSTNTNGSTLFVSAPNATNSIYNSGNLYVITQTANSFAVTQTLSSQIKNNSAAFGQTFDFDSTLTNLFIGVPGSTVNGFDNGLVERWINNSGTYVFDEFITHPGNTAGRFGTAVSLSGDGVVLTVGSEGSASDEDTTFDNNSTSIDKYGTLFVDTIVDSGAVYMFEPLFNQADTVGTYTYTQELEAQVYSNDNYGASIAVARDLIVVGAPGSKSGAGSIDIFVNPNENTTWNLTRWQQPLVDISSINRTFIYDQSSQNILAFMDYIDPAKGKVLNSVGVDIDYQLPKDPAFYNAGTGSIISDFHWGPNQVGKIWWNLDTVRYINYEQDQLSYRLNQWGQTFPGSSIDVYEWVESPVVPSKYVATVGDGVPLFADDSAYSTYGYVTQSGNVKVNYYFWVKNKTTINTSAGKLNSVYSITAAIQNPQSQGIPYATVLRSDTVALYNVNNAITGQNSVLHLESRTENTGLIHSEYQLVQEGNPDSEIPNNIVSKFIDSLAGIDAAGNPVPDPSLPVSQRYGISIRPRQTMIVNQDAAIINVIDLFNSYLIGYPTVESKVLTLMNSEEPVPSTDSGLYSITVSTDAELGYIDTSLLSAGTSVLVLNDSTQMTKWSIYTLAETGSAFPTTPSLVQSYKTNLYWEYADWYASTYDPTVAPDVTVADNLALGKLTLTANTYIKVLDNGSGNFVVYYIDSDLNKNLVGLENGTIQIPYSENPGPLELRQILLAIQTQLFIDDLAYAFNDLFFTVVKYILTEQQSVDWMFKTSFISATQDIRALQQFPAYIADNQDYYLDYINEVKPYRTVVREFFVNYQGNDEFDGDMTDFDLQPYWDANLQIYRSPNGEQPYDSNTISTDGAYTQWLANYQYSVVGAIVETAGAGYLLPPQIAITGGGGSGAEGYATITDDGGIGEIVITNVGQGYTTEPTITIIGTGTGASAKAVLRNAYNTDVGGYNLVRNINTTIKFDRVNYTNANTFVFWSDLTTANIGQTIPANTIIVSNSLLYNLDTEYMIDANITLPTTSLTEISMGDFDNANDRIVAFSGNSVNLTLGQSGIDYPGVIVDGNTYVGTAFDDNIQSAYSDTLGINPSDINVDGGAYVSTFSSHAPEELVPGRMFDSLNLSVYDTTPISFRINNDANNNMNFYRIASANTTVLTSNLNLTDTTISVADASVLPDPNIVLAQPGVIVINGEIISYYRNYAAETPVVWTANLVIDTSTLISHSGNTYITLGNIYDAGGTFSNIAANVEQVSINTLAQIRRGVDTTYTPAVHVAGTHVVDASINQQVPYSSANTVQLSTTQGYQTTSTISYGLTVTSPITANIGDVISQTGIVPTWQPNTVYTTNSYVFYSGNSYIVTGNVYGNAFSYISSNVSAQFSGNVITTVTMRVLQTITEGTTIPVIVTSGSTQGLPYIFDSPLGFDPSYYTGIGALTQAEANEYAISPYGSVITESALPTFPATVGSLTVGDLYVISTVGTTDWTTLGAQATAIVSGNITNGTNYTSAGTVLTANIGQYAESGNLAIGTVITGTGIAAGTYITGYLGAINPYLTQFSVSSSQYVPGNVIITGQPTVGTQFYASATSTLGSGMVTIPDTSAFVAEDTNDTYVFSANTNSYTNIGQLVDIDTFDSVGSPVYINGTLAETYVYTLARLGLVDVGGDVTAPAGTVLQQTQSWYTPGLTTPATGFGLASSTTEQVKFLKASPATPSETTP